MIQVECECGRVIKAKDEFAGKKVKCPECQETVTLPGKSKAAAASKSSTGKPSAAGKGAGKKAPPKKYADDELPFEEGEDGEDLTARDEEDEEEQEQEEEESSSKKKKKKGADEEAGGKSEKKKKKKRGSEDSTKMVLIGTAVVVGLGLLVGVGFLLTKADLGGGGGGFAVPKEFVDFSTAQAELTCQIPKGWETKSGGGSGGVPAFANFSNSGITIQFKSSPSGAAIQMMSQAGGGDDQNTPDDQKAVHKVHEFQKRKAEDEMSGYQEQGAPEKIMTKGLGEGRISAFTFSETFGTTYGYRGTLLGTNNQWIIYCKCSGSQWKDMQPIFKKIIESAAGN